MLDALKIKYAGLSCSCFAVLMIPRCSVNIEPENLLEYYELVPMLCDERLPLSPPFHQAIFRRTTPPETAEISNPQ